MPKSALLTTKICMVALCMLAFSSASWADDIIFANNYQFTGGTGADYIWRIDVTTGDTITNQYAVPVGAQGGFNGRGVVDVNDILYITTAGSGKVLAFNTSTSALSTAFTVAGSSGLSSISFDGTNFWVGDYSGTNHAYLYSPSGTLLRTISLANCTGFCDGLTYIPVNGGELISNRTDGFNQDSIYDIYSATTGALLVSGFINTTPLSGMGCGHTTGIAWDGTNYFVSCLDTGGVNGSLAEYGPVGNFLGLTALKNPSAFNNGGFGPAMEGLSANFAVTVSQTPEPATLSLLGLGLAGIGFLRRKILA